MRPVLVVPVEAAKQLSPHVAAAQRDDDSTRALVLERSDEAFGNRDAAVLADGAKPRLDACALAPGLEALTPELRALVADDVLGLRLGVQAAEEGADLYGRAAS